MHDLLFTVPGYPYPFEESVHVSWTNDVFTFTLSESGVVRSVDRCHEASASGLLDSFLVQLVGGEPSTTATVASDYDRVVLVVKAAREQGSPVASDPNATATAALRRIASVRRRLQGTPSPDERIEDLAKGLRDRFEMDPKMAGPLMADYRHLAASIVHALS